MKICLISRDMPPLLSGVGFVSHYLSNELVKMGHEVHVLHTDLNIHPRSVGREFEKLYKSHFCPGRESNEGMAAIFKKAKELLARERFDILHFQFEPPYSFLVSALAKLSNVPLVSTVHEELAFKILPNEIFSASCQILNESDKIVAVSKAIGNFLREKCNADEKKLSIIENGVDFELFNEISAPEKDTIVFAGRLSPEKGIPILLKSFSMVLAKKSAKLVVVGDGPERKNLENLAANLGISNKVKFTGAVPHNDLPKFFSKAEFLIYPHLEDGMSLSILEGMACNRAVIASNIGGLRNLVSNEVGSLFEAGNADSLAEKIIEFLGNKKAIKEKGMNARTQLLEKGQDWHSTALKYVKLYGACVK